MYDQLFKYVCSRERSLSPDEDGTWRRFLCCGFLYLCYGQVVWERIIVVIEKDNIFTILPKIPIQYLFYTDMNNGLCHRNVLHVLLWIYNQECGGLCPSLAHAIDSTYYVVSVKCLHGG
jgi:hypothetical protein